MITGCLRAGVVLLCLMSAGSVLALSNEVPIIYPKDHTVVYDKVNVVLDPTEIPFFQVLVGATEHPIVDTSAGRHAYQGVALKPGVNTITVKVFALSSDPNKDDLELVASREITVFSRVGLFTKGAIPPEYKEMFFHSRERETSCSGCHALEVDKNASSTTDNSAEGICSACHRTLPVGNIVHYPAAMWKCIVCHDPNLYPVKYQFTRQDPWKLSKSRLLVKPVMVPVRAAELFEPLSDVFLSKDKARKFGKDIALQLTRNPDNKVRLEVHTGKLASAPGRKKGAKNNVFTDNQALSNARARKLATLLKETGIREGRFVVAGMTAGMAGPPFSTTIGQDDDRVEIVYYPSGASVENNANLPELRDRERFVVNLDYAQGQEITKLKVLVKVSKAGSYVPGSALLAGRNREPVVAGDDLVWLIGSRGTVFSEKLSFVMKKDKDVSTEDPEIRISYIVGETEVNRDFMSKTPVGNQRILENICKKCHKGITEGKFGHEPVSTGNCTICHNPHASSAPSLLREPSWLLCTHCHTDKSSGVHVLVGIDRGSHPTKGAHDPSQPGKQFSCVSCHNPHSADNKALFSRNAGSRSELCQMCHQK